MKFLRLSLKFLGIIILFVLVFAVVTPYFFKDEIKEVLRTELNQSLSAEVDFKEVSLSLFRSFPNLSIEVAGLKVHTEKEQSLVSCSSIRLVVDLFSLMGGGDYRIKSVILDQPILMLQIADNGQANWDVLESTETVKVEQGTSPATSALRLDLQSFIIKNAEILYEDLEANTRIKVTGLDFQLNGSLSEEHSILNLAVEASEFSFISDGGKLVDKIALSFYGSIDADLKNEIYKFQKNTFKINELALSFDGSVAMVNDQLNLMFSFQSPDNSLKQLLSLVPAFYIQDYKDLKTDGSFAINGHIKGMYTDDKLPAFQLNMNTKDGLISYPEMPASISGIQLDATVENQGGDMDHTVVHLRKLDGKILDDPFSFKLKLAKPISDPYIEAEAAGKFKLSNFSKVFPQEQSADLAGELLFDMRFKGALSAIEEERYKDFLAMGSLLVKELRYHDIDFSEAIYVKNAQLNFSPAYIDLVAFNATINDNTIEADGKLSNYLAYYLKDDELKANLKLTSDKINVNELLEPWKDEPQDALETSEPKNETPGEVGEPQLTDEVIRVPDHVDFHLMVEADTVIYDSLLMKKLKADIHIHDQIANIRSLNADMLGGNVDISGSYNTAGKENPLVDMNLLLKQVDINQSYNSLVLFRQFTPIASAAMGIISMNLGFSSALDQNMKPVWSTLAGLGRLRSRKITVGQSDFFNQFDQMLNSSLFENVHTGPIDVHFKLEDGKIHHKPFKVKLNGVEATIAGWTSFEQELDYTLGTELPIELAGPQAGSLINHYISEGNKFGFNLEAMKSIKLSVGVTGTAQKPEIKLLSMGKGSGDGIKEIIEAGFEEKKEELLDSGKEEAAKLLAQAQADADEMMKQARQEADELIRLANELAADLKNESHKQSDALIAEAKKNGPVAAMVAKEAAKELLKEGDKKAAEAIKKASDEADKILKDTQKKADQLVKDTQKKVDAVK